MQSEEVTENLPRNVEDLQEDRCIGDEENAALSRLGTVELAELVQKALHDIFRTLCHNAEEWNQFGQIYRCGTSYFGSIT